MAHRPVPLSELQANLVVFCDQNRLGYKATFTHNKAVLVAQHTVTLNQFFNIEVRDVEEVKIYLTFQERNHTVYYLPVHKNLIKVGRYTFPISFFIGYTWGTRATAGFAPDGQGEWDNINRKKVDLSNKPFEIEAFLNGHGWQLKQQWGGIMLIPLVAATLGLAAVSIVLGAMILKQLGVID